jgi:Patatin-like phospholipase
MKSKLAQSALESKQFSGVFLPELLAVEARRRRYRIEQILGKLPTRLEELPPLDFSSDETSPATGTLMMQARTVPSLDDLKTMQQAAADARRQMEEDRKKNVKADAASPQPVKKAATDFLKAAKDWHRGTKAYRDVQKDAAKPDAPETIASWEQAEAIFAAAANMLSLATKEVRVEQAVVSEGGVKAELEALGVPNLTEKAIATTTEKAFGQVLAWENETGKHLKAYRKAANPEPGVSKECAKKALKDATAEVFKSRVHLALAERRFFEAAAANFKDKGENEQSENCRNAAEAAQCEVQRASRELHRVQLEPEPEKEADPEDPLLDEARKKALEQNLVGLSLSGGGIRSGTYALGVLQGLAQLRLLGMVDYLSTVSGGGYIGSWFAAWVHREGSLKNVERQLSPNRVSQSQAERTGLPRYQPVDPVPEPVHHLRAYSRYLSPRVGPYSTDTWALLVIYLRNLFVNSLFIVPLAVLAVFLWRMLLHGFDDAWFGDPALVPKWAAVVIAGLQDFLTLVFVVAFFTGTFCLFSEEEKLFDAGLDLDHRARHPENYLSTHRNILLMLLILALTASWLFSIDPNRARSASYEDANLLHYFGQYWIDLVQSWLDANTASWIDAKIAPWIWAKPHHWPNWLRFALAFVAPALIVALVVRIRGCIDPDGSTARGR